jgi:hypothetical protein
VASPLVDGCKSSLAPSNSAQPHLSPLLSQHHHRHHHPRLSRRHRSSPPPTAPQHSTPQHTPHPQGQLRRHHHALHSPSPHPLPFSLTQSLSRKLSCPSPLFPRPSRAAVTSSRSRPAPMTVRQLITLVMPRHRQHRLRSSCLLSRVRRRVRRPSQPAPVTVQHHAHRRLHALLRRRHLASSPPTPSPHSRRQQSLTHPLQLRARPHARHPPSPRPFSLSPRRSSKTSPTTLFSPLQPRAAGPSLHSRPAPMTLRQPITLVMPHHRQLRLRSP